MLWGNSERGIGVCTPWCTLRKTQGVCSANNGDLDDSGQMRSRRQGPNQGLGSPCLVPLVPVPKKTRRSLRSSKRRVRSFHIQLELLLALLSTFFMAGFLSPALQTTLMYRSGHQASIRTQMRPAVRTRTKVAFMCLALKRVHTGLCECLLSVLKQDNTFSVACGSNH
jgi:hypothetical protein